MNSKHPPPPPPNKTNKQKNTTIPKGTNISTLKTNFLIKE